MINVLWSKKIEYFNLTLGSKNGIDQSKLEKSSTLKNFGIFGTKKCGVCEDQISNDDFESHFIICRKYEKYIKKSGFSGYSCMICRSLTLPKKLLIRHLKSSHKDLINNNVPEPQSEDIEVVTISEDSARGK